MDHRLVNFVADVDCLLMLSQASASLGTPRCRPIFVDPTLSLDAHLAADRRAVDDRAKQAIRAVFADELPDGYLSS